MYDGLFASSRFYRWTTFFSLFLLGGMIFLPISRLMPVIQGNAFIPLHYNIFFGVDRFGPWEEIFIIPIVGACLLVVNLIFGGLFFAHERILASFFVVATFLAEMILFVSMIFVILLNV
jgi:hypothetical protein